MSEMTVSNVAKWFLSKESMTPKKLQKIVYYAYAWFLTYSTIISKLGFMVQFVHLCMQNIRLMDIKKFRK